MPKLLEVSTPLRQIRDSMNEGKGMAAQDVAVRLVKLLNEMGISEEPKTYAWILRIEERGTRDRYYIKGLSAIYNKDEEEIAEAALPSQSL